MKEYDLFKAIGSASDTYLMEIEEPKVRPLPRRFGFIAAVLALLLTACAAPVIAGSFDKVQSAVRSDTGRGCEIYVMINGSRQWKYDGFRSYDAEVQVSVDTDAPQTIQEQYFPQGLLTFCTPQDCQITDTGITATFSMVVPRYGTIYDIRYEQHTIPADGKVTVPGILGYSYLEQTSRTFGTVEALVFHGDMTYPLNADYERGDPESGRIYSQILFWSDGQYLYCLKLPLSYNLPVTEVEGIITSLAAVEDITQYFARE